MTKKFLPFEIARFKREAKVRSKTTSSTYSQSLDEIADREGWDNWSLLSKHRDKDSPTPFYMFARTQAQQKE